MSIRFSFLRVGLGLGAWLAAASTLVGDEVVLKPDATIDAPGGRIRGTISRETPEAVTIDGRTVPLDQIEEIDYTAPGLSYTQARLQRNNGNLERAIELYKEAAAEASKRLVAQASRFEAAALRADLARSDAEQRDEAIAGLEAIVEELPNSRHVGPALERLAEVRLSAGQFDEASQAIDRLARLSWASRKAEVLRARLKAEQGDAEAALADLESLLARLPEGSADHRTATLAKAVALAKAERYDEAEDVARSVIESAAPEDARTLAPAYNTLGACLRAAGKPKDALFAYLHTELLYNTVADEHAEALTAIADLWRELGREDRAQETLERLREQHPGQAGQGTEG